MPALSSHEGGGPWPGGVSGMPPAPGRRKVSPFGDGSYSGNIIQGGSTLQPQASYTASNGKTYADCVVITGAATVAPDAVTGSAVFMAQNLVLEGASASLTAAIACKGLLGFVSGELTLLGGATIHMNGKGKAGNFGAVPLAELVPSALRDHVPGLSRLAGVAAVAEGAPGALAASATVSLGVTPAAPTLPLQTGGGGAGCSNSSIAARAGHGGKGGPFCGGAGGGGYWSNSALAPGDAGHYGGPGGPGVYAGSNGAGGGAGDPNGPGVGSGLAGNGPGGGLLWLVARRLSLGPGCTLKCSGSAGGNFSLGAQSAGAGSGGGSLGLWTEEGGYANSGTVSCPGGPGGTYGGQASTANGGVGSVNILTLAA